MDDNLQMAPGWSNPIAPPPPPPVPYPSQFLKPLYLRPLWIAFLLAAVDLLFRLAALMVQDSKPLNALAIAFSAWFGIAALVYYFMCIHRMIKLLATQPDWWSEYTPAGVVWRQFVPFYGVYVLYQWTGDVESYTSWRLGVTSKVGLTAFIAIMIGFGTTYFVPLAWLGHLIVAGALTILYIPVQKALSIPPPAEGQAPRYDGSLGLR